MAIPIRNARHNHLKTLCAQWLRRNNPKIYRYLTRKALTRFPIRVRGDNSFSGN